MIEYIRGVVSELSPARVILESGGIGYEIHISLTTYTSSRDCRELKLFIHEVIREDAHLLYGFSSLAERELFLLLISVSGVGANTARMILSSNSPEGVVQIISSADERGLTMIKGIGAKTAQRIIVDLRSKVKLSGGSGGGGIPSLPLSPKEELSAEAISALVMLGFQKAASEKVIEKLLSQAQEEYTVERLIKLALRELK